MIYCVMDKGKSEGLRKCSRGKTFKVYVGQPDNISERSRYPSPDSQVNRI